MKKRIKTIGRNKQQSMTDDTKSKGGNRVELKKKKGKSTRMSETQGFFSGSNIMKKEKKIDEKEKRKSK